MPLDQQITIRLSRDETDTISVWAQRLESHGGETEDMAGFARTEYLHDFLVRWRPEYENLDVIYMRVTDHANNGYEVLGITFPTPRRKWVRIRVRRTV